MQAGGTAEGSFEAAVGVSVFSTLWGLSTLQNGPKGTYIALQVQCFQAISTSDIISGAQLITFRFSTRHSSDLISAHVCLCPSDGAPPSHLSM